MSDSCITIRFFNLLLLTLGLSFIVSANEAFAVQQSHTKKLSFIESKDLLKPSVDIPVSTEWHTISISPLQIKKRIILSGKRESVESVELLIDDKDIGTLKEESKKFAVSGKEDMLFAILKKKLKNAKPISAKSSVKKIVLEPKMLKYINLTAIQNAFKDKHLFVTIKSDALSADKLHQMLDQASSYIGKERTKTIEEKYAHQKNIIVDQDFLPDFAMKMAGKYTIYKGPNCFHAALAFQNSIMPRLPTVNIKVEDGYHRAMINYDELWNILQNGFYEVNPTKDSLKYGDVLIFFETKDAPKRSTVDFHWIRHATTYLFNNFTFSKGSKSPNTPYTIKNIEDEWSTWEKYTKKLGLKIFRRKSLDNIAPPRNLYDWIY